jgi:hypothetical protein
MPHLAIGSTEMVAVEIRVPRSISAAPGPTATCYLQYAILLHKKMQRSCEMKN